MKDVAARLYKQKNQWLASQIDVDFPTPESLKGRDLYTESLTGCYLEPFQPGDITDPQLEWHCVDFHRLTVMFALLQSERWVVESQKNVVVEFFAQIILDPTYELFISFHEGKAVAAAMITRDEEVVLISDIVASTEYSDEFIANSLIQSFDIAKTGDVWIEKR